VTGNSKCSDTVYMTLVDGLVKIIFFRGR